MKPTLFTEISWIYTHTHTENDELLQKEEPSRERERVYVAKSTNIMLTEIPRLGIKDAASISELHMVHLDCQANKSSSYHFYLLVP